MAKFVYLYVGGLVPPEKRDQNYQEWGDWTKKLTESGHYLDGAPFGVAGNTLKYNGMITNYDWTKDSNVTGYSVIEAADLDEATDLAKDCPQLFPEYGEGMLEVREWMSVM